MRYINNYSTHVPRCKVLFPINIFYHDFFKLNFRFGPLGLEIIWITVLMQCLITLLEIMFRNTQVTTNSNFRLLLYRWSRVYDLNPSCIGGNILSINYKNNVFIFTFRIFKYAEMSFWHSGFTDSFIFLLPDGLLEKIILKCKNVPYSS